MTPQDQGAGPCTIINCGSMGRVLGHLGKIKLTYCPKHRKYGQEVINTFLDDVFNYKRSQFQEIVKQELLFNGSKILDDENEERLGSWFKKEIHQRYIEDIGSTELRIIGPKEGESRTEDQDERSPEETG